MDILQYISENYIILIAVLYVVGAFLKNSSKVPDWTIPWILMIISIVFSVWMGGVTPEVIMQGILVAGAAVMANQLYKQTITEGFLQFLKPPQAPKQINPTNTTDFRK